MPPPPPASGADDPGRRAVLHTPTGHHSNARLNMSLLRFHGVEALNEPFRFEVDCLSQEPLRGFDDVLGKDYSVEIKPGIPGLAPRFFDGVLTEGQWLGEIDGAIGYRLVLRPRLWLTTLSSRHRIFHNLTVRRIIEAVLSDHGISAEFQGSCGAAQLEYTVQFGETDFDFVSRLLQKYGMSYWFRHVGGAHRMMVTDDNASLPWIERRERAFQMTLSQHHGMGECFDALSLGRAMTTGQVTLNDYDFTAPRARREVRHDNSHGYEGGSGRVDVYPGFGDMSDTSVHSQVGRVRGRQAAARDRVYHASGNVPSLTPGMRVTVTGEPLPDGGDRKDFIAVRCIHAFTAESYRSGGSEEAGDDYQGHYELMPFETPLVPPRSVAEPRILGPQTAMVVGDGEIDCDRHGRVLVRFHWDTADDRSMRCRVMQPWAGNGWGSLMIPRVGMEVVVEFLDGDPDRPIVTGSVYNGDNRPPVDLPGAKAQSGFRSRSLGKSGGYNEFVIDDSDGQELMRVHAQKDLQAKVLNDEKREVGGARETDVKGNDTLTVGKALTITATDSITLKVGGSKVEITPDKVVIQAGTVEVKAGIELKTSAGASASHVSGGQMEIKGALVMIN